MCNKPDPSAPVQLNTSLTVAQLVSIRSEANKIVEAANKAIALGYFAGNLLDKFGDIQKCQDEEFMNVHNAVDAILDSLGVPLVGDDMPIDVTEAANNACRVDNKFIPFVSIEDLQCPLYPHPNKQNEIGQTRAPD